MWGKYTLNANPRSLSTNPRGGYYYRMSYEIVTPESAEYGDAEDRGWELERSDDFPNLKELIDEVNSGNHRNSWTEWSSSNPSGNDWIISSPDEDYRTGAETSYHLFIKRNDGKPLSAGDISYITDELGLSRFGRMMPRGA